MYLYAAGNYIMSADIRDIGDALVILKVLMDNDVSVEGIEEILALLKSLGDIKRLGINFVRLIELGYISTLNLARTLIELAPKRTLIIVAPNTQKYLELLRKVKYTERLDQVLSVVIANVSHEEVDRILEKLEGEGYVYAHNTLAIVYGGV